MMTLKLFDTYRRETVPFTPLNSSAVGIYSCGPTVYDRAHIGNLRTYIFVDLLRRVLSYNGFKLKHVMNITDVGHLVSDADTGEDKMEKGSRLQHLSAWAIAKKYEALFFNDTERLNILKPNIVCRATEHIEEQIEFIQSLQKNGFTYITVDGVYFDTSRLNDYGYLARLDVTGLRAGTRVALMDKKNVTDFALWKFSGSESRQMEWHSPWGNGFPGWHIECSAMAEKYLGPLFDIHVGGEDHIPVHHSNEIAQSQARNNTSMANFWMHGYFLQIDNERVAKSGKSLNLDEIISRGFDPVSYRYLTLTAHYRSRLNFSWESLKAASKAMFRLRKLLNSYPDGGDIDELFREKFFRFINDDLNMPMAIALMWEVLHSAIANTSKKATIAEFDHIFGLGLSNIDNIKHTVPKKVIAIAEKRLEARKSQDWATSDLLRAELLSLGFTVDDHIDYYVLEPLKKVEC